jgi:PAT family beta-lactamase induction signal transducer AmpG
MPEMSGQGNVEGLELAVAEDRPTASTQPGGIAPPSNVLPSSVPPGWVIGMATTPFGLVAGFTITALPFLLTRAGVPLDHVASVSATAMSPAFWGFLLNPLLDTGLSRQTYCWITAGISALSLALAMWVLSSQHLALATSLLLLAELSAVLYASAVGGWTTEFVPESLRGSVGGWTNVANLGAGALGSLAVMSVSSHIAPRWIGLGLALAVLAGAAPLLAFPTAKKSSFALNQVFSDAMRNIWQASKRRPCLVGFALFLAPASASAAINLFSGLGTDFHSNPGTVIAVTGLGCAITASVGSLLGGFLSCRLPRGYVYLSAGIAAGLCALTLAFTPHTQTAFVWGVLIYNGIAGVAYAAFTALGLQLVGHSSPVASTQLGLFAAATNGAIVFMTWADGRGYRDFGVRGLLTVDGVASLATAIPLLFLVYRELRSQQTTR